MVRINQQDAATLARFFREWLVSRSKDPAMLEKTGDELEDVLASDILELSKKESACPV